MYVRCITAASCCHHQPFSLQQNYCKSRTEISLASSSLPGGITAAHSVCAELHFGQPNNLTVCTTNSTDYITFYNILSQSKQICRIQSSMLRKYKKKKQGLRLLLLPC